jgi:hypothetical protein
MPDMGKRFSHHTNRENPLTPNILVLTHPQQSKWCSSARLVHFQGVQQSLLHQQSKWCISARLVHFLLWQAAKPSGDKCTP